MKMFRITLILLVAVVASKISAHAQAPVQKNASASEMPPALKNMEGTAGYDKEHQKWVDSQKSDPAAQKAQAAKSVKALESAQLKSPASASPVKSSSEGTPYHNYKGITDPAKAKEAWAKDQAAAGK